MKLNLAQTLKKIHREQISIDLATALFVANGLKKANDKHYSQQEVLRLLKQSKPKFIPIDRCGIARHLNDCGDASDY
jgi:hypothetical protein